MCNPHQIFTGCHEHSQFGCLHYPFRLHHKAQQLNPPFRTWSSPSSITTVPNYYNHLEYCSLSFTISPKLRHRRVHVDGVRLHSNGWQSHVFFYSHQCLWVFYTVVYMVFFIWWPVIFCSEVHRTWCCHKVSLTWMCFSRQAKWCVFWSRCVRNSLN